MFNSCIVNSLQASFIKQLSVNCFITFDCYVSPIDININEMIYLDYSSISILISMYLYGRMCSFRAMRRIPAVVWRHRVSGGIIARSSQPEVGWLGWRSAEDERLLAAFVHACNQDRPIPNKVAVAY